MRKYRPAATLADSLLHTLAHFYEHNTQTWSISSNFQQHYFHQLSIKYW